MISISDVEASRPDLLLAAGQQTGASVATLRAQLSKGDREISQMTQTWTGDASTAASANGRRILGQQGKTVDALARVQSVLSTGGGELQSAKQTIGQQVSQLQQKGWQVSGDGSVTVRSGSVLGWLSKLSPANALQLRQLAAASSTQMKTMLAHFEALDNKVAQELRSAVQGLDVPSSPSDGPQDPGKGKDKDKDQDKGKDKDDEGTPAVDPSQFGLNDRQMEIAKTIVDTGKRLGYDKKAIQIALTTALTESTLRNLANDGSSPKLGPGQSREEIRKSLDYPNDGIGTDHASVGVFQQQLPWYGKVEDLMDPAKAAEVFFNGSTADPSLGIENKRGLKDVDYENMSVWDAAQKVQGSFDPSGGNYKVNADLAGRLTDALY